MIQRESFRIAKNPSNKSVTINLRVTRSSNFSFFDQFRESKFSNNCFQLKEEKTKYFSRRDAQLLPRIVATLQLPTELPRSRFQINQVAARSRRSRRTVEIENGDKVRVCYTHGTSCHVLRRLGNQRIYFRAV